MKRRAINARGELQCYKCKAWKPRDNYTPRKGGVSCGAGSHCRDCQLVKRKANRAKTNARAKSYRALHSARLNAKDREDYARRPEHYRAQSLRSKYGLTMAEYDVMLAAQQRGCAICHARTSGRAAKPFHIDHDHNTKKVRGLLCNKCNVGLGSFRDSPAFLRNAALYLEANL